MRVEYPASQLDWLVVESVHALEVLEQMAVNLAFVGLQ